MRTSRNELAVFFAAIVAPFYVRASDIGADEYEKTTLAAIFAPILLITYRKLALVVQRKIAKLFGLENEWTEVELVEASLTLEDETKVHPASYWRGTADGIKTERFAEQTAKGD